MPRGILRGFKKSLKVIIIAIGSLLLLMFALPYILPGAISNKIKALVNRSIDGKVEFSKARLSFFNHFPSLTLTLYDFTSTGSAPYRNDTLLSANELAFGIDLPALIGGDISINKFFISGADIRVLMNEQGEANYNVYRSGSRSGEASASADTSTALKIEKIVIENSNLQFSDLSSGILINADGLNYSGKGDLSKAIFDLASNITIDSFDIYYDHTPYLQNEKINAELVTSINTNSLELKFTKNRLRIHQLPLLVTGSYEFLSNGYRMNFVVNSEDAGLDDVFTVLPPSYEGWLKNTRIKGLADINAVISGMYIAGTDTMPTLQLDMKIRNGQIAYDQAPIPVTNLYLDFASRLPAFNMDSLSVTIDSLFFNLEKDHFSSALKMEGTKAPYIDASISSAMDLEKFDRALGLQQFDLKGMLMLQAHAKGRYVTGQNPNRIRKDIIVTSIPAFTIRSSLQNGYIHYTPLPKPVRQINFEVNAGCPDHDYRHTSAAIENIDIKVLDNYIKGFVRIKNADSLPVDAELNAVFRLSDIQQFYPLDSMDINGDLMVQLRSTGNYQPAKKIFPKTEAVLNIENGSLRTRYYPAPLEKIAVNAIVQNKQGTFSDLNVDIKPVSFVFEGNPFIVKANLQNFDNLHYDILSKGNVDLGKIYKVFSQKGWDLQGTIETDLSLKGSEADATTGRLHRLENRGTLKVNNVTVFSDLYPLPFIVHEGIFRFNQDRVRFERLKAGYGKTAVVLDGFFSDIIRYIAGKGALTGKVQLNSDYLMLDELMAYKSDSISVRPDSLQAGSYGVIMVPGDLDLAFKADIKDVDYNNLRIKSVKGEVVVKDAGITMRETGFEMAGAVTKMNATYKHLSPTRAFFTYQIAVDELDVKKMYTEVELFRKLAPAAGKAEGIISVNYELKGMLDGDMYPVMASLNGGGVLSVKKVKMKGLRFFSVMSRETGKNEINDPDVRKINLKTTVRNNVITLEKTKLKVAGFRIRMQGQTSFNGRIKFNCRLGLPPFGIIGIPMKITGTGQDPKVKLGKTDELPLEEQQAEISDTATADHKF